MSNYKMSNALDCIKHRCVYDISQKKNVFVNKLIYWGDVLFIKGYTNAYKVEDYDKTWKLPQANAGDTILGVPIGLDEELTEDELKEIKETLKKYD